MATKAKNNNINLVNKKAKFEYAIIQPYSAGMVLKGTEIKAIREGKVSFNDSFCLFINGELYVRSLHISEYSHGTYANHNPASDRKLLLHKRELRKINDKVKEKGLTIVPLRIYTNEKGIAKMDIAVAQGKKLFDKRATIKERDIKRELKKDFGK